MNNSKRPTAPKPFNSKTTHPASIPNMPNKSQKREHVTSSNSGGGKKGGEGKEGGTSTELEIGQSGGAGGGGTGAGSLAGAGNEGDIDSLAESGSASGGKEEGGKGIDSSKVHPGSIGSGNGKGKRDSKL
jgi:hypothetical protein